MFKQETFCWMLLLLMAVASCVSSGDDDVFLEFYLDQVKLWDQQDQQTKLQAAILPGLQAFCGQTANFDVCGINSTKDVTFTTSNVVVSPGYPVNANGRYLDVRFKITYSAGSGSVTLPADAVTEIAQNQREAVSSAVGYYVVYINDIKYSIPPPAMANKVIVPIMVLGTVTLIIVAMALRHYQLQQHRKLMRQSAGEMKPPQEKNSRSGGNKVGTSGIDLAAAGDQGKKEKSSEKSPHDEEKKRKKKKMQQKKKTSDIDWSAAEKGGKGKAAKDGSNEFNNVGFDKSINEGDPRSRQSAAEAAAAGDSPGDPRASQSALSEIIQVRGSGGDDSSSSPRMADKSGKKKANKKNGSKPHHSDAGGGVDKAKKSLSSSHGKKDAEAVMLMDGGVFNPPEANVTDNHSGSEDSDGVPTLRDASDQQMI